MNEKIAEILQNYYPNMGCNEKAIKELTTLFEEQRREDLIKFYMFNYNNSFSPDFSVGDIVDEYLNLTSHERQKNN